MWLQLFLPSILSTGEEPGVIKIVILKVLNMQKAINKQILEVIKKGSCQTCIRLNAPNND